MFWNRFPFARILLPFLTGIIIAVYFELTRVIPIYFIVAVFLFYAFFILLIQKEIAYRLRWISGSLIILFFLLAGYQVTVLSDSFNTENYFNKYITKKAVYVCTITEPVQIKDNYCKAFVEISAIRDSMAWHSVSGKALIYFEKDSLCQRLNYGDNIMVTASLEKVKPPMNPGEYNYKDYLKRHSVEYSAFLKKKTWKKISSNNGNFILEYAYNIRQKLLTILANSGIAGKEYAVISALLIGYTDKLDPDLIKEYQGSGAMHILSVSGMHVGVIYLVLNFFLFFFDKFKYGRIPKAIILILFVWAYAILTGLSPAVLRAATMFTFISIGNSLKYPPNIFNTLAVSAFMILLCKPYYLFDIGFQLSYLAVFGIVAIYPLIYKSWNSKYRLINKLWSLIAVSIAAQLVTFPLCLYYFHQFPNYFIFTNIVVVPLSALVIYFGIAYLIFYSVPFLSVILAKALSYSLLALNGSISFIEGLPYSVSRSISVTAFETTIVYLIIITVVIFLILKKPKMLISSLSLVLVLLSSISIHGFQKAKQRKIIVYNINKHTAVDFYNGNHCYFVVDSSLRKDKKKLEYHIFTSRINFNIQTVDTLPLNEDSSDYKDDIIYQNSQFISFAGKKMVIVNKATLNSVQIPVDFVLLSNNPRIVIDSLLKQYHPEVVIIDGSNYQKNTDKWISQCTTRKVTYYVTSKTGAWIYEL